MLKKFIIILSILILGVTIFVGYKAYATTDNSEVVESEGITTTTNGVGLIAAALAIGLSAIGSGIAVSKKMLPISKLGE